MHVSPDTSFSPDKALEGFSHLRSEMREEVRRFRERFRSRAIGLTSHVSAGLPLAVPIDFDRGRAILRGVLEEVAEQGDGCTLEVGLDAERAFPGVRFELSFRLFGEEGRLAEIDRRLESRLGEGKSGDDAECPLETFHQPGMCGWKVAFPSHPAEEEVAAEVEEPFLDGLAGEAIEEDFAREHPHDVLVVDDSAVGRRLTVQILRNLGYDPAQAHNGKEAVRLARERRFTVIFMDLRMPDMDGVETMREIFRLRSGKARAGNRPAVIALTAEISDVERNHCIDAGMSDFLTKPCRPAELCQAIRSLAQLPVLAVAAAGSVKALTPWREAPVSDETTLRTLWEMPGGRLSTLLEDLFEALLLESPASLRQVEKAAQSGNETALRHEIHQLTGNFDVMGARRLALLCRTVGDCVKGGQPAEADRLISEISGCFDEFRAAVEAFIEGARSGP